jgi:8-oxo-dGTP diphosphatase
MVSAAGIIRVDDAVLTIRDVAQRMLVLPGGHLHWRESPEAGLIREVREETGYIVEPVRLFGAFSSDSGFSDRGIIRIIYEARLIGGEERSSPEGDVAWLKLDQLDGEKSRDAGIIRQWLESGAQVAR